MYKKEPEYGSFFILPPDFNLRLHNKKHINSGTGIIKQNNRNPKKPPCAPQANFERGTHRFIFARNDSPGLN